MRDWVLYTFCILILIGAACWSSVAPAPLTPELDSAVGTTAIIDGVIVRDPDVREKTVMLTVRSDVGTVLVMADRFNTLSYGDHIRATGKIELPSPFETDSGRTFNYPKYLLAHGVTHTMAFAQVEVLAHGKGNTIVASLIGVKHLLLTGIGRALPEPESALLAGLLLGDKQSLGESLTESFRRAGVIHMIVLSGYNITVVVNALLYVCLRYLPRLWALIIAGLGIAAFAVMTGASETTLRASLMAGIALVAMALYRPRVGLRLLAIASAALAVWNPYLVLYDLSYQLSVLATLGLMLFSEPIKKRLTWVPETLGIREITSTTIATQVAVLPLIIASVGQVSLVSLVTNILVLGAVPYAMFWGFVAALVALVSYPIALPFTAVAYTLLTYIIHVSVFLGSLPFASIQL